MERKRGGEKRRIVQEEGEVRRTWMRGRKGEEGMRRGREKERCRGGEEERWNGGEEERRGG